MGAGVGGGADTVAGAAALLGPAVMTVAVVGAAAVDAANVVAAEGDSGAAMTMTSPVVM
jgi:hypothetical protein